MYLLPSKHTRTRTHFAELSDPLHVQLIHHVSPPLFNVLAQDGGAALSFRVQVGPLDCSPGLSERGEVEKKNERSRKEEMMEGRPTITVCFLACWGLQHNLLHLLADTSWRVIRRVEGTRGLRGDLARHLYCGPKPAGNGAKSGDKSASFVNINSHLMTSVASC